ncbi:MAG: glycerol kinase GlpK [Verrucomicrobiales bacterium]|nr:glycerol kinase GlpK [Verrucomicrobiales bacterium]
MPKFILALDQGTTSSRSIIFDSHGSIVSSAQEEYTQIYPEPGRVEHDAKEIWASQLRTAREVIANSGVAIADIAGIGITNQRETVVVWDRKTGEPVTNAIVWQDRRTAEYCRKLSEDKNAAPNIQRRTGLIIDAYFSGSKLRWILENVPGVRERAENGELAFGTVDSWLVWNLTGGALHITDAGNASRTMLCRIDTVEWDPDLLQGFDIPASMLPEIRQSSEIYGSTIPELFGSPLPVAGIAGDQHAALFGQACHSSGMAKNTYGTGCFLLMNTGTEKVISRHNLLTTVAWQIDGVTEYALEGSVFIAGAVVQWLRDQLGIIEESSDIEALAQSVEDSGGVYFVPAFAGLGAPHWDGFARGTIVGMTRGTNKAHLARAALEAIAFQSMELIEAMEKDSGIRLTELRVDGGATKNDLLMQIQADLLDVPVVRSNVAETTALGAAYLAGLATGVWADKDEIAANWKESKRYLPSPNRTSIQALVPGWKKAVERSKDWAEHK